MTVATSGLVATRTRTPSCGCPPLLTVPLICVLPECAQLNTGRYGYVVTEIVGDTIVGGKAVDVAVRVGVAGRGVALGVTVGMAVAVGGAIVVGGMTRVAVAVSVGVAEDVGALVAVGVHVGGSIVSTATSVEVGNGGLKGLNATRGLMKMMA